MLSLLNSCRPAPVRPSPAPGRWFALAWGLAAGLAPAATSVWDGGASGLGTSWNSAGNWQDDLLPAQGAGTDLLFHSRNGGSVLLAQMSLGSSRVAGRITFDGSLGGLPDLLQVDTNGTGGSTARTLTLHGGLTLANTSNTVMLRGANGDLTLALAADNRWDTSPGSALLVRVPVSGNFALTLEGSGTVRLDAAGTHSGGTQVQGGTLLVGNSGGSATGSGPFALATGAVLGGSGRVAPAGTAGLTLGGLIAPGLPDENGGVGTLTLAPELGDAVFTAEASLELQLGSAGGSDRLVFASAGGGVLDFTALGPGRLRLLWASGGQPALQDRFDLLDWSAVSGPGIRGLTPGLLDLPTDGFQPGWQWDTSQFAGSGVLTIVPEPSRFGMLGLAAMAAWRRRRSPARTGEPASSLDTLVIRQTHLAIMTGTDQQPPLRLRPEQQGGETVCMGGETRPGAAGLEVEAQQSTVRAPRHRGGGIEIPQNQHLASTEGPERSLLLGGALKVPEPHFTVAAPGGQAAAVGGEGKAQHGHRMTGERAFDAARGDGEDLGGAIAAGGGHVPAVGTDRQGQHPVGMRLHIPEQPALRQGKTAHPVVGTADHQILAIGAGHRTQGAVAQAGQPPPLTRPGEINQPDLAETARRSAGDRQQWTSGDETESEDAFGQVSDAGTQLAVLGIPGQHLMITAGGQHLAVAIERQGGDRDRPGVAFRHRRTLRPLDQAGQGCLAILDVKGRPIGDPGAQQLDLRRRQRIGLLRHAIVRVVGEEESHQLALPGPAGNQGRFTAVAWPQQRFHRVEAIRPLGLLGAMTLQALVNQDGGDLAGEGNRGRTGGGSDGKELADDGRFHGDRYLRMSRPVFLRPGSKGTVEGVAHRGFEGPRAVAAEPFVERFQALDEVGHLPARHHATGRRAKVSAAAKGSEIVNCAAVVDAERRAGTIRAGLELLATRGTDTLGGQQGLAPGQHRGAAGQAELAAAGQGPAVTLGRSIGQIPVNRPHLGEGVSETGGRLPAGHGKKRLERVVGIEPTWPAWKAGTLPLSYTRRLLRSSPYTKPFRPAVQRRILPGRRGRCRIFGRQPPKKPRQNLQKGLTTKEKLS